MLMIKPFQWLMSVGYGNVTAQTNHTQTKWIDRKTNVSVRLIKFATLLSIGNLYCIQIQAKWESEQREIRGCDVRKSLCVAPTNAFKMQSTKMHYGYSTLLIPKATQKSIATFSYELLKEIWLKWWRKNLHWTLPKVHSFRWVHMKFEHWEIVVVAMEQLFQF